MAYIDDNELQDYPFDGTFYTTTIDTTVELDEQTEVEEILLETKCDITEASHARVNGFLKAMYAIHVPFDKESENGIVVNRGDLFRAWMYGMLVKGKVEGVFPSQLGGFTCYVQADEIANQSSQNDTTNTSQGENETNSDTETDEND